MLLAFLISQYYLKKGQIKMIDNETPVSQIDFSISDIVF